MPAHVRVGVGAEFHHVRPRAVAANGTEQADCVCGMLADRRLGIVQAFPERGKPFSRSAASPLGPASSKCTGRGLASARDPHWMSLAGAGSRLVPQQRDERIHRRRVSLGPDAQLVDRIESSLLVRPLELIQKPRRASSTCLGGFGPGWCRSHRLDLRTIPSSNIPRQER